MLLFVPQKSHRHPALREQGSFTTIGRYLDAKIQIKSESIALWSEKTAKKIGL